MKIFKIIILIIIIFLALFFVKNLNTYKNSEAVISIYPEKIYAGNPVFISLISSTTPQSVYFNNKQIPFIKYRDKYISIYPIDLNEKKNIHKVIITLNNSMTFEKDIVINEREKIVKKFDIPTKLGGNTKESSNKVVSNLSKENYKINSLKSENRFLWNDKFIYPLEKIFLTDGYGYNRDTTGNSITHKGTDFRAIVGTDVFAINDGVIMMSKKFTVYGNTIIIDHGNGIMSLYMHLSEINVKEGDIVKVGQKIGKSGDTGYVLAPHLHLSIKINGVSIDPIVFFDFFNKK